MHSLLLDTGHEFIGINSFFIVVLILISLLIGGVIQRYKIHFLPESAAIMMFGFVVGAILNLAPEDERTLAEFSANVIFFIVLPPIILDAGYTLRRKRFFANFGTIITLAVMGTMVNNLVFGYTLFGFAKLGWLPLNGKNPLECLLFGAVISATDPVAVLAILGSKEVGADPLLYSLVFGESVLNDAISIVLYKTFERILESHDDPDNASFTFPDLLRAMAEFTGVSIGSVLVGVFVALVCSFLFRRLDMSKFPVYEFTLVTLFAYLSYFMAEMMYLSGIMSLFFCSVCLAHYNFYNISTNAQISTQEAFKSMAQMSETFVFAYIGIEAGLSISSAHLQWHIPMCLLTILCCLIARAANIFPLCGLANLLRWRNHSRIIPFRMQIPLWFSGLRGAVAFALSLSFLGPEVKYVVSSTLVLVLFTTLVGGGLTMPILEWAGMTKASRQSLRRARRMKRMGGGRGNGSSEHDEGHEGTAAERDIDFALLRNNDDDGGDEDEEELSDEEHSLNEPSSASASSAASLPPSRSSSGIRYFGVVARFKRFDQTFMRKWFGGHQETRGSAERLDDYGASITTPKPVEDLMAIVREREMARYAQDQEVVDTEVAIRALSPTQAPSASAVSPPASRPQPTQPRPRFGNSPVWSSSRKASVSSTTATAGNGAVRVTPYTSAALSSGSGSESLMASTSRLDDAGSSYRRDEDELKSIFRSTPSPTQTGAVEAQTATTPMNNNSSASSTYRPPSYTEQNVSSSASPSSPSSSSPTNVQQIGNDTSALIPEEL